MNNIKEVMDVVSLVKVLGEKIETMEADGKVSVFELIANMPGLVQPAFAAFAGADQIKGELAQVDSEGLQAIVAGLFDALAPYMRLLGVKKAA